MATCSRLGSREKEERKMKETRGERGGGGCLLQPPSVILVRQGFFILLPAEAVVVDETPRGVAVRRAGVAGVGGGVGGSSPMAR